MPRGLVGGVAQGVAEEFEDVGLVAQPFAGGKRGALFLARGIRQAGWAHRTFACDRCLKRRDFSGEFNPLLAATGRRAPPILGSLAAGRGILGLGRSLGGLGRGALSGPVAVRLGLGGRETNQTA